MPDKICTKCGINPRKITKSGNTLTMCTGCQQEYWRAKKREKYGYKPHKKRTFPKRPPRS